MFSADPSVPIPLLISPLPLTPLPPQLLLNTESLLRTVVDLELFAVCESLATIASVLSADLSRGFSALALLVACVQLVGAGAVIGVWLTPLRPARSARLLRYMCNACLALACVSLLTSSAHTTHISAALLVAAALAQSKGAAQPS